VAGDPRHPIRGQGFRIRRRRSLLVVAAVAVLAACSSGTGSHPSSASPAPSPSGATAPPTPEPVVTGKPGSPQLLARFFGSALTLTDHGAFGWTRTQLLARSGPSGGPALRVIYPAGSASQRAENDDDTADGGAQAYLTLSSGPLDDAWLAYDLRFPAGFRFVKGGKLPGLFGGTVTSGQQIPDGTDGFSTRYMWRTEGAGEVYAYLPSSVAHGTSIGRGQWTWPTGRWAHVVQHVHLNSPGAEDGTVDVWLDSQPVLHQDHLRYRTVPTLRIDGLFFSTFFGGGDATWASPTTQHADFANFVLSGTPLVTGP